MFSVWRYYRRTFILDDRMIIENDCLILQIFQRDEPDENAYSLTVLHTFLFGTSLRNNQSNQHCYLLTREQKRADAIGCGRLSSYRLPG
jgi:hypothetical protein